MSDLASLKAHRLAHQARGSQLADTIAKLDGLRDRVSAAQRDIESIDADHQAALLTWAKGGCVAADVPELDHAARNDACVALARALNDHTNSGAVHQTLAAEQREVSAALASVQAQIELAALGELEAKRGRDLADFSKFIETEVRPRLARLFGLHAAIVARAREHANSDRQEQARPLLQLAERLTLPGFDLDPRPAEILEAATGWSNDLAALMGEHIAPPLLQEDDRVAAARAHGDASAAAHRQAIEDNRPAGNVVAA